jgi:hypothetical protein
MKKTPIAIATLVLAATVGLIATQSLAQQDTPPGQDGASNGFVKAQDVEWSDAGPLLPKGAEIAIIEGDLADEDIAIVRLRFPGDYVVPPHTHSSTDERVTILKGVVNAANEREFDKDVTTRMEPFSYFRAPAKQPHFVWTPKGEGAVVEIVMDGKFDIEYINPEDDPRRAIGGGPDEGADKPRESKEPQESSQ